MVNVLVVYYSRTGNTKAMAETIADAAHEEGAVVRLKEVADASTDDLVWADGIVIGSPVYFGLPASEIKKFIEDSISVRRQLENKVGAAFASSGHRAGGRETTIMALLVWSCAATRSPREGTLALLLPERLTIRHPRSARV